MFDSLKKKFGMKNEEPQTIVGAPLNGKAVALLEVNDPTFAEEMLGKGIAIIPSEGKLYAPADGEVTLVFETKHAISVTADFGAEILMHVGLDTVMLKGQYYTAHVQTGDKVKKGDLLLEFDISGIKEAGYDIITPILICNTTDYADVIGTVGKEVSVGDDIIEIKK